MIILKKWLNNSTGELHYSLLKHDPSVDKVLIHPATSDRYMSVDEYLAMFHVERKQVYEINVVKKRDLLK